MPNFVSNQLPWPKYFELSLVTIFSNTATQKPLKKLKLATVTCNFFNIYFTGKGTSL